MPRICCEPLINFTGSALNEMDDSVAYISLIGWICSLDAKSTSPSLLNEEPASCRTTTPIIDCDHQDVFFSLSFVNNVCVSVCVCVCLVMWWMCQG